MGCTDKQTDKCIDPEIEQLMVTYWSDLLHAVQLF